MRRWSPPGPRRQPRSAGRRSRRSHRCRTPSTSTRRTRPGSWRARRPPCAGRSAVLEDTLDAGLRVGPVVEVLRHDGLLRAIRCRSSGDEPASSHRPGRCQGGSRSARSAVDAPATVGRRSSGSARRTGWTQQASQRRRPFRSPTCSRRSRPRSRRTRRHRAAGERCSPSSSSSRASRSSCPTLAVWTHQVAFNTDRFTALVEKVVTDPAIDRPRQRAHQHAGGRRDRRRGGDSPRDCRTPSSRWPARSPWPSRTGSTSGCGSSSPTRGRRTRSSPRCPSAMSRSCACSATRPRTSTSSTAT